MTDREDESTRNKLGQKAVQEEVQQQVFLQHWAVPSFLPKVSALIESSPDVRNLASLLLDDTPFRGREDHVLAALVPEFRPFIDRFYAEKGPPLGKRFEAEFIASMDQHLAEHLPRLVMVWAEVRKQVYTREGTTREAIATFRSVVDEMRLFRFGSP